VALVLQWRQDYTNNRPPTRATAISAMGHLQTYAVQRTPHQREPSLPYNPHCDKVR
jgi:hypothetical protein